MKVSTCILKMKTWTLLLISAGFAMTSCNVLDEEDVDCSVEYRVKFKYDNNMKFADAFANEVSSVVLYAFDENGKFVYQRNEEGDILAEDGYTMPVEVKPGDYNLVTWAKGKGDETFSIPVLTEGVSTIEDLNCKMDRIYSRAANGTAEVRSDLRPLFHGQLQKQSFSRAATEQIATVRLTKNTNNVRIVLQHLSGEAVDVNQFTFTIEDDNGLMNYNNNLMDDEELTYYAWRTDSGIADMDESGQRATTAVGVAIAELTVGRLVMENNPILSITNKEGEKVLSIPLIDYALLVKGYYNRDMTDQEYLDRQDEYTMTFFLDDNDQWASSSIIINSWKVVLDNVEL
jgi:hypothetical protein